MKEKIDIIIKFLSKPVISILLIILMVAGIVFTVYSVNTLNSLSEKMQELPVTVKKEATSDEIVVETVNVEENYQRTIEELQSQYKALTNPQEQLVKKVEKYINVRFNFEGRPSENKDRILDELQDVVSEYHYDYLEKALTFDGVGNMGVSMNKSTCSIEGIYYDVKKPEEYKINAKSNVAINLYAIMNLNSSKVCYRFTLLENRDNDWVINEISNIAIYNQVL